MNENSKSIINERTATVVAFQTGKGQHAYEVQEMALTQTRHKNIFANKTRIKDYPLRLTHTTPPQTFATDRYRILNFIWLSKQSTSKKERKKYFDCNGRERVPGRHKNGKNKWITSVAPTQRKKWNFSYEFRRCNILAREGLIVVEAKNILRRASSVQIFVR